MSVFSNAKTVAEIADIASRIYGLLIDKSRANKERDDKIKDLERQLAELKSRLK